MSASPLIVAHRGASADAPENTLAAFQLAWEQGADAIEGDFHLAADGHVVCIHDTDTGAISNRKLVVGKTSLADLKALDLGERFGKQWAGTRIPTLPEVLATIPARKGIFIEVKCGAGILPRLIDDLDNSGIEEGRVTVISYEPSVIAGIKTLRPGMKALWITRMRGTLVGRRVPSVTQVLAKLRELGADGLSASARDRLSGREIQRLRNAGLEFHVWTIDRPRQARAFIGRGAASITTNRPQFLREQLGM